MGMNRSDEGGKKILWKRPRRAGMGAIVTETKRGGFGKINNTRMAFDDWPGNWTIN